MAAALSTRGVALLLAALAVVPFARVVFAGHVLYERDIQHVRWGEAEAFAQTVAKGSLPLWNAFVGFGRPLLADPGMQALYPWTWLGLFLQPHDWYDAYAVFHVLLGGLGAFALARRLGGSVPGSFLSGALFLLAGPFLSVTSLWQHLAGAALVPWVLVAGEAALEAPSIRRALVWGAVVALQVLAGSLDFVLLGALAQAVLAVRLVTSGSVGARARRGGAALGAAAFAALASAAQWLPALELLRASVRAQLGESVRVLWSVHPVLLLQALAPFLPHGLPLSTVARAQLFEGREPLLSSLYLGAASVPLVVAGLAAPSRRLTAAIAALGIGSVLLALGRHGVVYFMATGVLPLLEVLRYPAKAMVLAALAWALLAGRGVDAWREAGRGAKAVGAVAACAVAACLLLVWREAPARIGSWLVTDTAGRSLDATLSGALGPVLAAAVLTLLAAALAAASVIRPGSRAALLLAMIAVAVLDVALAHREVLPSAPRAWFTRVPAVVAAARQDGARRLYLVDYLRRRAGSEGPGWKPEESQALKARPRWESSALLSQDYPPDGTRWALPGGYDIHVAELDPPARLGLGLLVRFHQEDAPALARLLRMGGVTHLAARHREGLEAFDLAAVVDAPQAGRIYLMRVPQPLPRVYVAEGVRVATGRAVYGALGDAAFDPGAEVVLPSGTARPARAAFGAETRLSSWRPGHVVVDARLDRPGTLVVLESFDSGWKARVDGRPVAPVAANGAFIGVPLEAGSHRVELAYAPASVAVGAVLSAGALLGALAWSSFLAARSRAANAGAHLGPAPA